MPASSSPSGTSKKGPDSSTSPRGSSSPTRPGSSAPSRPTTSSAGPPCSARLTPAEHFTVARTVRTRFFSVPGRLVSRSGCRRCAPRSNGHGPRPSYARSTLLRSSAAGPPIGTTHAGGAPQTTASGADIDIQLLKACLAMPRSPVSRRTSHGGVNRQPKTTTSSVQLKMVGGSRLSGSAARRGCPRSSSRIPLARVSAKFSSHSLISSLPDSSAQRRGERGT